MGGPEAGWFQDGDFVVHFAGCHDLGRLNDLMVKYYRKRRR
jgi:hypothetical protein